jgi:hypothetical protein
MLDAVTLLREANDALAELDPDTLDDDQLQTVVAALQRERARAAVEMVRLRALRAARRGGRPPWLGDPHTGLAPRPPRMPGGLGTGPRPEMLPSPARAGEESPG